MKRFKQVLEKFKTIRWPGLDKTRILIAVAIILILINVVVLLIVLNTRLKPADSKAITALHQTETASSLVPVIDSTMTPTPNVESLSDTNEEIEINSEVSQGMVALSMVDAGYSHLYLFEPGRSDLIRLTYQPWDDVAPSFSPDGKKLAFSSRRNGYWDIYVLDLSTGNTDQLTDTAAYDSSPSWSPDGKMIVFESYLDDNFELFVADLSTNTPGIQQITNNNVNDYEPDWSPDGNSIVFVSTFNDQAELWKATILDNQVNVEPLRVQAGKNPSHPRWSPDGTSLIWEAENDNRKSIFFWRVSPSSSSSDVIVEGEYPAWSPDGQSIFASITHANQSYFAAYTIPDGSLVYPVTSTTGRIFGVDWSAAKLPTNMPDWMLALNNLQLPPLYQLVITPPVEGLENRFHLVPLPDVNAPYPQLHDLVDEPFQALRERLKQETGWDVLANLQSAFTPISESPDPGIIEDWRYTGRAINLNPIPLDIDWMFITLEPYGDQTFFHLYIRPLYQDGSMGAPVKHRAWDINARFDNKASAYESGGEESQNYPAGYWVDLTDLALRYGWEREPASPNWLTFYEGAHFNQFVFRSGLSWREAMLEVYPTDIFTTPTVQPSPTITLSPTKRLLKTLTPSMTYTPSLTSTRRPTWTPMP